MDGIERQDQAISTKIGLQQLSYENEGATECEGEGYAKRTYKALITLKPQSYDITIEEYDYWPNENDVVSKEGIIFKIDELYNEILHGKGITRDLDDEKTQLRFFKK